MLIIAMGVSGTGKTSFGKALAAHLELPFIEGDDFHSTANVAKMASGEPLQDADRWPWLTALGEVLAKAAKNKGCVMGCSALKASYRELLTKSAGQPIQYMWLHGSRELLLSRLQGREGHFFPPELLESQFEALEEPADAIALDVKYTVVQLVRQAVNALDETAANELP